MSRWRAAALYGLPALLVLLWLTWPVIAGSETLHPPGRAPGPPGDEGLSGGGAARRIPAADRSREKRRPAAGGQSERGPVLSGQPAVSPRAPVLGVQRPPLAPPPDRPVRRLLDGPRLGVAASGFVGRRGLLRHQRLHALPAQPVQPDRRRGADAGPGGGDPPRRRRETLGAAGRGAALGAVAGLGRPVERGPRRSAGRDGVSRALRAASAPPRGAPARRGRRPGNAGRPAADRRVPEDPADLAPRSPGVRRLAPVGRCPASGPRRRVAGAAGLRSLRPDRGRGHVGGSPVRGQAADLPVALPGSPGAGPGRLGGPAARSRRVVGLGDGRRRRVLRPRGSQPGRGLAARAARRGCVPLPRQGLAAGGGRRVPALRARVRADRRPGDRGRAGGAPPPPSADRDARSPRRRSPRRRCGAAARPRALRGGGPDPCTGELAEPVRRRGARSAGW